MRHPAAGVGLRGGVWGVRHLAAGVGLRGGSVGHEMLTVSDLHLLDYLYTPSPLPHLAVRLLRPTSSNPFMTTINRPSINPPTPLHRLPDPVVR